MSGYPWNRFVMPWQYAPSPTGAPAPGDLLNFFASGTSEPQTTYADATLSTENPNPMVADQNGLWGDIFLQNLSYKVVWTDADGVEKGTADPVSPFVPTESTSPKVIQIECTVDGNGGIPPAGGVCDTYVAVACTLTAAVLQANGPGDLVLDVWVKEFETNTPPSATDSIVASAPPTLSSSTGSIDTTLSGWTVDIPAGSWVRFSITSIADISRFTINLVATPA